MAGMQERHIFYLFSPSRRNIIAIFSDTRSWGSRVVMITGKAGSQLKEGREGYGIKARGLLFQERLPKTEDQILDHSR
mgnify:CR=1 FL=1